jgi:hypothetical protein
MTCRSQHHAGPLYCTRPHSGCCTDGAPLIHVQILRMASGAAANEALLSQLNVARNKMRRSSGCGGDSSGEGGVGNSDPLAAGSAASMNLDATAIDRAFSCPVSAWGQLPPNAVSHTELQPQPSTASSGTVDMYSAFAVPSAPLEPVQHRLPSAASADGTGMYGAFEDAAWSPAAGDAGGAEDDIVVVAQHGSGGGGGGSAVPAHVNPFAAAAEQRQQQSQSERLAAQEPAQSQWPISDPQGSLCKGATLGNSDPNDSAIERHGSLVVKCQDYETAGDIPNAAVAAVPAAAKTVGRKPSPMNDCYSAFRSGIWHIVAACRSGPPWRPHRHGQHLAACDSWQYMTPF